MPRVQARHSDHDQPLRCEDEVKAVLGLPDNVSTYALMPIGYPEEKFGPLARKPVAEVAYADRWGVARPS
jgi:hypothetical protein